MKPTTSQNKLRLPFVKNGTLYVYDLIDISSNESIIEKDNLSEINIKTNHPTNSKSYFHQGTLEEHHNSIVDFLSFNK